MRGDFRGVSASGFQIALHLRVMFASTAKTRGPHAVWSLQLSSFAQHRRNMDNSSTRDRSQQRCNVFAGSMAAKHHLQRQRHHAADTWDVISALSMAEMAFRHGMVGRDGPG